MNSKNNEIIKQNSYSNSLVKEEKEEEQTMRFFSHISNKIIWAIASLLLIGAGYVAILNFWLKPKPNQITINPPTINTSPTLKSQPQPVNKIYPNPTQNINIQKLQQDNLTPALALPNEIAIKQENLVRGASLKIFEERNFIRSKPSKVISINQLKLSQVDRPQELTAYFEIPESGYYYFKIFGIKDYRNSWIKLPLRIDGALVDRNNKQPIYLEKGWSKLNFQADFYQFGQDRWTELDGYIDLKNFALKWRDENDKAFTTIEPYRNQK